MAATRAARLSSPSNEGASAAAAAAGAGHGHHQVACLAADGRLLVFALDELKLQPGGGKGLTLMEVDAKTPLLSVAPLADSVTVIGTGRGDKPREDVAEEQRAGGPRRQAGAQGQGGRGLQEGTAPGMTTPALPPLWRQREYMLLWTGQVAATLGGSASGIVVPLLVLAMTGSATCRRLSPRRWASCPTSCSACRWACWSTAGTASG